VLISCADRVRSISTSLKDATVGGRDVQDWNSGSRYSAATQRILETRQRCGIPFVGIISNFSPRIMQLSIKYIW
jgi:hypothetical protein